jgi:DUF2934 family protein
VAKAGSSKSGTRKTPDAARKVLIKRARVKTVDSPTSAQEQSLTSGPVAVEDDPSDEDVRVRAYFRYLERGGSHGASHEDWTEAKKDLASAKDQKK